MATLSNSEEAVAGEVSNFAGSRGVGARRMDVHVYYRIDSMK